MMVVVVHDDGHYDDNDNPHVDFVGLAHTLKHTKTHTNTLNQRPCEKEALIVMLGTATVYAIRQVKLSR
jgi:hypothetical protein